ncbi:MAG: YigZ family protein [Erysipelotrichaceae bacterium]|nr:YigZ family protein [Erysipelotrichaceae bacterium]
MKIAEECFAEYIVERSRFLCTVFPCESEEAFKERLQELKAADHDATHACYAWCIGGRSRSNDDGEPAGTAGMPILAVLQRKGLEDCAAVVIRYFGGIKLGKGGLFRAYGKAVEEALASAVYEEEVEMERYQLVLPYDQAEKVRFLLEKEAVDPSTEYGEQVIYRFCCEDGALLKKLAALTKGAQPVSLGKEMRKRKIGGIMES